MKTLFLLLFCALLHIASAQRNENHLYLSGTVLGYDYDPAGFFKKEKVAVQGSLEGVKFKATDSKGKTVIKKSSTGGGAFSFEIPLGKKYTLSFTKEGYGNSAVELDLRDIPSEMKSTGLVLNNMEFILNDNETDKAVDNGKPFARVYYDKKAKKFKAEIVEFKGKDKLFKKLENSTPVNLLKTSLSKNAESNTDPSVAEHGVYESPTETTPTDQETNGSGSKESTSNPNPIKVLSNSKVTKISDWKNLTKADIDERAKEISEAWDQLEKDRLIAVTKEDFLLIQAREQMLIAAEEQLAAAEIFLEEQDEKLSAQNNVIYALIGLLLIVGAFVFFLIKSIKEKKRTNKELAQKNKRIMSSITYAERIQKSVLLRDEEIKKLFPNSFILYKPLDIVSGDFYWFSKVKDVTIMAAIDCTGHGVPGAFMSLIANTLMNQIVNEKGITQPADILKHLHEGIVESLKQEEDESAAQDGMDLAVCAWNESKRTLTFAGAMNPIYIVKDDVQEISANLRGVGGIIRRKRPRPVVFNEEAITVEAGSSVYLFSDGFMDQFGGENKEKFNVKRFKQLLIDLQELPADQRQNKAEEVLKEWQGKENQIDDILLIGVSL